MDDFPEFETYADVIDAYERDSMGYSTLTDYIKGNNIKIKEIDISPLSDLENLRNGGPVGIEILFTEKVPAAPSQLVSESDILLGYRGDAAYRSGSLQSSSIGQGNVGSKASFGGGKGRDRSGRDEGAGGADRSKVTQEQNINQIRNQLGIKDPNLIQKTFDTYNRLPLPIKGAINTIAPVDLMKIFNIGNAINTGVNQMKYPDITEEDVTLGIDNLRADLTKAQKKALGKQKMGYDMGLFTIDDVRENIKPLGDPDKPATNEEIKEFFQAKDGGRVGLFMGGPALEGTALNIYNSMNAYGFSDQEIANALQERGLYTPPGSDSGTPPQASQTLGYQGGDDKPMIRPVKKDPKIQANLEAIQRSQALEKMGIQDPFASEGQPGNEYYGDMMEIDLSPGKQSMFAKAKQGLSGAFGKVKGMMDNPVANAISFAVNPLIGGVKGIASFANKMLPTNERAFVENAAGNLGIFVDDIGRIVNMGDYMDPNNIMAGYNLNMINANTFQKRIDRIRRGRLSDEKKQERIELIREAQRKIEAAQKLARLQAEQANLAKGRAPSGGRFDGGSAAYTNPDTGVGGGQFTDSLGNVDYQDAYDPGGGEKDGGLIGYNKGGLATMFRNKR